MLAGYLLMPPASKQRADHEAASLNKSQTNPEFFE